MDVTYKDIVIPRTTVYVDKDVEGSADTEIKRAIIAENQGKEAYKKIKDDLKKVTYEAATNKATLEFRDGKKLEIDVSTITVVYKKASKDADVNKVTVGDTTIKGNVTPGSTVKIFFGTGETKPNDWTVIPVNSDGTFSFDIPDDKKSKIGKILDGFQIETKEPGKGKEESVKLHRVQPKTPDKTDVRDPKNLTETEKDEIKNKIIEKNTLKGQSLLPDGTGGNTGKKARIFFENGNVIIKDATNDKLSSDPIPIADIVNDIKPDQPTITADDDKLTFAPKSIDTDAKTITINYDDPQGNKKTAKVTKENGTWTSSDDNVTVDGGVISLLTSKVNPGSTVTATVTDNAGQTSDPTSKKTAESVNPPTVKTKAVQITELGGLDPVVMKKWVGETPNWKDGVKVKDGVSAENKKKIDDLLAGAKFDDFQDDASKEKRNTDKANNTTGFVGKIKVKFGDGSELVVDNQTLYVSDHVTWFSKEKTPGGEVVLNKNTPDDAIDVEFKLGKGTKIDNADGKTAIEGNDNPVSYQKYKVKPGTDLKTYMHPTLNGTIYNSINNKLKAQDNFIDPKWDTDNFTVTEQNKVFTATATEAFKVTVKPNGGTKAGGGVAEDIVTKVKKNGTYTLPAANTFNPPNENQEFAGWKVGDKEGVKKPNTPIDVKGNITITATWKPKSPGSGSGSGSGTGTGSGSGTGTGTGTGTGETATPGTTPEPSQPGNTPGTTPGSENPTEDNPTDSTKNPNQKDKPEDKKTGEDNKNKPNTPNVEKGDKVINVGDKEVVVPKVIVDKKKGKLDKEERTKIAEKIKQKNPDVVDVKIDENANAYVTFNDGRRERIPAKDLLSKEGFMIPRRDRHSQDESPNRRRAGKNVKTGVESITGIACTLVASTGALYIGRKKED